MSSRTIPVDLFNPGQVFACLGLVELSQLLIGDTCAAFDWSDPRQACFVIRCGGETDPVEAALGFLARAEIHSVSPDAENLKTSKWKVDTAPLPDGAPFPIPAPRSPATLPALLAEGTTRIELHSWGDGKIPGTVWAQRDNVKFWAGSGGYPGAAILRDALDLVRDEILGAIDAPFELSAPQSGSFRFDWRRDYIPIDVGFSLNAHPHMSPRGFPLVEILALIGISYARPERLTKLDYRYSVCSVGPAPLGPDAATLLPPSLLRAALGSRSLPFPTRSFRMRLDWPGQENQARCITSVYEESHS
ncbi:MAG: type I-U CRISPR-associated protein Cas8c [Planctomycetota bacterium]|nr:MAG: type I-U CRISPR-associated protein Cas8c [Planctomycetota bacterium]